MKLSAIGDRGVARDFWDLHAIIESTGKPLDHYVEAFKRKYPKVDVGHIVRGWCTLLMRRRARVHEASSPTPGRASGATLSGGSAP
ncbi:MAG: hypothetical protein IT384_03775 [Deltaproteobacteria bacterium]|nr:hypothetical protein [Deltaproteobacteria bacterium]